MAYAWRAEQEEDGTNPKLEAISAWLFRGESRFLAAGGLQGAEASLFSMAIGKNGFDPDEAVGGSYHARTVPGLFEHARKAHYFESGKVEALVADLSDAAAIADPRVYIVPVATDGLQDDQALIAKTRLGGSDGKMQTLPPPKAFIGIIDHGINFFHQRFRRGTTGSRVIAAWDQGAGQEGTLPFGAECSGTRIERAQEVAGNDEDALLRQIGADFERPGFRPLAHRSTHGTHVLDLAAGMDPLDPEAEQYPIIAVNLLPEVARETTGSMLALPFVLGLEFILSRARAYMARTGHEAQVFVNFSFGLSGGPRHGLHRLEQSIQRAGDWHMAQTGRSEPPVIVVPAGNRNLARGHARAAPQQRELNVTWHIQPADPTANFLEFRLEAEASNPLVNVTLNLTPPGDGATLQHVFRLSGAPLDGLDQILENDGVVLGRASLLRVSSRVVILTLALAPSDPGPHSAVAAPAGDWQVSVKTRPGSPASLQAWILRDDVPHGFRDGGRQSYFVDSGYADRDAQGRLVTQDPVNADSVIRRAGSFNALATAHPTQRAGLWTVGGYQGGGADIRMAPYSGRPHLEEGERLDVNAISDRSLVRPGLLAAGTRSGTRVAIGGTSVAAPQLTRWLAMGQALPERRDDAPEPGVILLPVPHRQDDG